MSRLPLGWANSKIGDMCEYISRGKSPKYTERSELPVVNQKAIRWFGIQDEHLKYIHPDQFDQWAEERFIREGDILWNSTGTGTIGRACLISEHHLKPKKVVDSHVTIVRPHKKAVDPRYLFAWIRGPQIQHKIEDLATGTTNQIELSRTTIIGTEVPLAPLNEQKRIAEKLDSVLARVDACREHLDRVPAILKRFRQSVLAAATTGKLTEEWREELVTDKKWKNTTIGAVLTDIRYGTSKKCRYEPKKTPVLRIPNVLDGEVNHADLKYADFEAEQIRKLALTAGDILMIRSNGSLGLVGRTALVSEQEEGFLFAGYLIRIRVNRALVRPAYICFCLMSPTSRNDIELVARSTSGVNNINTEEIKALAIRLPCIEEQDEIVRRVESLFAYANQLEANYNVARAKVERLTPAILAKAFRGELVPQDPNDEPASVLLERIRAAWEPKPTKSKKAENGRGVKMTKLTAQSVKDLIRQLPDDRFNFDDLRTRASTDYETLKEIVFDLLSEAKPTVKQVFDTKAKSMWFVRVNQ